MRLLAGSVFVFVLLQGACGGAAPTGVAAARPSPPPAASSAPPAVAPLQSHALARSAVHSVVVAGLGSFLRHVELDEDPVFSGGKFHGFRIAKLRGEEFWSGVDLAPGDVVTSVNGMPIERPEQAQKVFESLDVAREIRVAYERQGKARELVYDIVDGR